MNQPPLAVAKAIVRCLTLSPRTADQLAAQLKNFAFAELRHGLKVLRDAGTVACSGGRWFLRGLARADLIKAQEKETLQEIYDHAKKH